MRNLKKILALVLALVMSISVMSIASAEFKDAGDVNPKFAEAVEVLNGIKVFQGYTDGSFKPGNEITRAEVAAIIYRIDTGDITGSQSGIYADYGKFTDVISTEWYAGYVNYCANANYVRGYNDTTFGPTDKVTGFQALAMIMRALGYDKNGEFAGDSWTVMTAKYAQRIGLTKNVDINTLGANATRELVAELLFRALVEENAVQVRYTLLTGYVPVAGTIGAERFGLEKATSVDEWGRVTTGWIWKNGWAAKKAETPIETYTYAVTECELSDLFGGKNVTLKLFENGVEDTIQIDKLDTKNKVGEQGTLMEVYSDRIVMIDTYLAVVNETIPMRADKAGHVYQYPENGFHIYGIDPVVAADAEYDPYVDGNDYVVGDMMLVNYNEEYNFIVPFAAPETMNEKQTHIWWNAEKHTIKDVPFMDNVNYTLDEAGYDKSVAYTWYFDQYNNVIGSSEIVIPEKAKNYAVVLGAQWINPGFAEEGYALVKLFYLDGTETVTKLASIDGTIVPEYADALDVDFSAGKISTTYQLNEGTEAHLYVVETAGDAVKLTTVDETTKYYTEQDGVILRDGKSQMAPGYYGNNLTTYFYYEAKTDSIRVEVGYNKLTKNGTADNVDMVVGENDEFVQFVYVYELKEDEAVKDEDPQDSVVEKLIYVTGEAFNTKLGENFALLNVVDGKGATDMLIFPEKFAGSEAATQIYLDQLATFGQDTLLKVGLSKLTGKVVSVEVVDLAGDTFESGKTIAYVTPDDYYFDNTGVLKIDALAINVNHNTTIIKDGETGKAVDNKELIYGQNLYVVYHIDTKTGAEIADYIFITENTLTNEDGETKVEVMIDALVAGNFEDVSATVYEIEADATVAEVEAGIAERVAKSGTVKAIKAVTGAETEVAVELVEISEKMVATFEVTITAEGATKTVTIKVALKEKAAE